MRGTKQFLVAQNRNNVVKLWIFEYPVLQLSSGNFGGNFQNEKRIQFYQGMADIARKDFELMKAC